LCFRLAVLPGLIPKAFSRRLPQTRLSRERVVSFCFRASFSSLVRESLFKKGTSQIRRRDFVVVQVVRSLLRASENTGFRSTYFGGQKDGNVIAAGRCI
jgi:hypothetical protein